MDQIHNIIIVGKWFFGITGFLGLGAVAIAPMILDAPGSEKNPATIMLFLCIFTYPLACLLSITGGLFV